jgi:uncharacterized membrane protein YdjX (TVP38/TMEM64 family)
LLGLGALGYVVYVAAFAFLQPFGVPGVVFVVAASLVWPREIAAALSLAGGTAGSVVGFSFARYVARDWVEKKIPPRLRKYDERLAKNAFVTVFFIRIVFWFHPTLHFFFGLSRVRFATHLVASLLGYILPIIAITYLGDTVFSVVKDQPRERWIIAGVVIVVGIAALIAFRLLRKRRTTEVGEIAPRAPESGR